MDNSFKHTLKADPLVSNVGSISFLALGLFFSWLFMFSGNVTDASTTTQWIIGIMFLLLSLVTAAWIWLQGKSVIQLSGTRLNGKIGLTELSLPLSEIRRITFFPKISASSGTLFEVLMEAVAEGLSPKGTVEIETTDRKWRIMQIQSSSFLNFIEGVEKASGKPLTRKERSGRLKGFDYLF